MVDRIPAKPRETDPQPPKSEFVAKLEARWEQGLSVCVGLDPDITKLPPSVTRDMPPDVAVLRFTQQIIDATADLACAFKPNAAFFEKLGHKGVEVLGETIHHIKHEYPRVPVILDFKRGDIGNTNLGYVYEAFDEFGADAVTVNGYLGREALQPFLDRKDKGILVLARTSNSGAGEFQDLPIDWTQLPDEYIERFGDLEELQELTGRKDIPLYQVVAYFASRRWNANGNVGLVAGATYPDELAQIRSIAPDAPLLIPGIGTQGGEVEKTVRAGRDSRNQGMIINSSSGIIFASSETDYPEAARKKLEQLTSEIDQYRLAP